MEKESLFLNKHCKLVRNDSFVLYGYIRAIDQFGVIIETPQRTSWISFLDIKELLEHG